MKHVLDNGLTVIIHENHAAPVVALNVWVNVGAADESESEAGISHIHEHMLFKGTERRGVGQVALEVESAGGDINAFTSNDVTMYHITIASRYLELGLDILADAVQHSKFDPGELTSELEVIMEELRRMEDNPRRMIYLDLADEAYAEHNYSRPVIGYADVIENMTRAQIMEFWSKWYVPQNMTLVVVGDVTAAELMPKVEKLFNQSAGTATISRTARKQVEPEQKAFRGRVTESDINEVYMYLGFHIPEFGHPDMAALDLIGTILGTGETSRLVYRTRSELKLVNRVWAYAFTPRDPGLMMVGADLSPQKAEAALEEILKQVLLLKHEPVKEWELIKAKTQIESDSIYSRETVEGQSRKLGYFVTLTGDPDFEDKYLDQVQQVTADDIQRAARKYLNISNLSVAFRVPQVAKGKQPAITEKQTEAIAVQVEQWEQNFSPDAVTKIEPITPPVLPPKAEPEKRDDQQVKQPVRFELPNGIRLIVKENHAVPLVSVRSAFLAGLMYETPENNGINNFISETVTQGTKDLNAEEIHGRIEAMAGQLAGFSGRNSMGVTLEVISKYFDPALEIMVDVLRSPSFPAEEIEKARMIILSSIRAEQDQSLRIAFNNFRSELYREHPFGLNVLGTEKTVQAMTRDQVAEYYKLYARPSNLVISVVGDVSAQAVYEQVKAGLGDWRQPQVDFSQVSLEAIPSEIRTTAECQERSQANIVLGFQGTTISNDDLFPLSVMTSVLSGMGGRLFMNLRSKQSLAYHVTAFHLEGLAPGYLGVYIGTSPEKQKQAVDGILGELDRIVNEPVSQEELARAQHYLIGEFEIDLQRNSTQAGHLGFDELYGLGYRNSDKYAENIQKVTIEDIQAMARKYIQTQAYVLAVVGPCEDY